MAGLHFTSQSSPVAHRSLTGGLNSTSGPLSLQDNESSDLQNVDFNKFGSVLKRNGYTALNTSALSGSPTFDGLHWYEAVLSGSLTRFAIAVANGKLFKMDDLDGTWDDITDVLTITAGNHCDFENFLNEVYIANGVDPVFKWAGTSNGTTMTLPTNVTKVKYVRQFSNYLFIANVFLSGNAQTSRIYWSNIKDTGTWVATNFIDISKDDGQEITGIKVLSDRLVIFKNRSIYNLFFTGDSVIPFVLPGGGKSSSSVGCIAPFSIQEVENGLVFLSYDGFYYYDGNNSYKISDKITTTLNGFNTTRFNQAVSLVQKVKNRYVCSLPYASSTTNSRIVSWDYYNNAFSIYTGMAASAMSTFYVSGIDERPYFGDYAGFSYRMDISSNDNPLNVQTAINAYYYTNWKDYDDLCDQKGIPHVYVYYQTNSATLTFAYSYDFQGADQYSNTFNTSQGTAVYGSAIYGTDVYAGVGGAVVRRDLTGRGRTVRMKIANSTLSETFQIDGLGAFVHLETNV